jgi:hypothetical protein
MVYELLCFQLKTRKEGDTMSESLSLSKIRQKISDCNSPEQIVKIEKLFSTMAEIQNLKERIAMMEEECASTDVPIFYFFAQSLDPAALGLAAASASNRRKQVFREHGIEDTAITSNSASSEKKKSAGKLGGLGESF